MVAIALATALAGCGSSSHARTGKEIHRDGGFPSPRPLTAAAPDAISRDPLPEVGVTQHVDAGGARLAVTLRRVIDPLRNSGADLQAGARAVGVVVQIRSTGPQVYDSSATGDLSVVASSGAVTPMLATRGICKTPVNDFDRYITAGEDRVGCVVFAIDDGATLDAVRFSPHARARGRLTWAP